MMNCSKMIVDDLKKKVTRQCGLSGSSCLIKSETEQVFYFKTKYFPETEYYKYEY